MLSNKERTKAFPTILKPLFNTLMKIIVQGNESVDRVSEYKNRSGLWQKVLTCFVRRYLCNYSPEVVKIDFC